jgi:hypothetical protein
VGKAISEQLGADHYLGGIVKLGAFQQLMALLRHPEADAWRKVAMAVALAPVQGAAVVDVADVPAAVGQAAKGHPPAPSPTPADAKAATWETTGGLIAHTILDGAADPANACTAIVSLDTDEEIEHLKWSDCLHLGNLVAGLGDKAVITTTRTFVPAAAATGGPAAPAPATDSVDALLEDCFDDDARALAATVAQAGNTDLVVGFETDWPDGTVIEVAWPARKIGILPGGAETPADANGWIVRRSTDWTAEELSAALASGTS